MYAIIEAHGEQLRVSQGDEVRIDGRMGNATGQVEFHNVLLIAENDSIHVGTPFLDNASVKAEVKDSGRSNKVLVFKQKPRKGHRKLRGHRQHYTTIKITDIVFGGKDGT